MTQKINLKSEQPIIHIKAYGGIIVEGMDSKEVSCDIDAPQLATMVEENGHVYITVNSSCKVDLPRTSSIIIEKGMGSIEIKNIHSKIEIEKTLGNLLLKDINEAVVEKVGGNFAVQEAEGGIHVEKVGGNLILDKVGSFSGEKIGGSCFCRDIHGDVSLEKAGGSIKAQNIKGVMRFPRLGGTFIANKVSIGEDIKAGGAIILTDFLLATRDLDLRAGGSVTLEISDDFEGAAFSMRSDVHQIRVALGEDDLSIGAGSYEYKMGESDHEVEISSGGSISLTGLTHQEEDVVGDISDFFDFEESPLSELISERVRHATRKAEAKVRAAQIRLDQMTDHLEKIRIPKIEVDFGDEFLRSSDWPEPPMPPVSRPAGKKGASNEERLMILKMLEENKISVDEAEKLFGALEK